jgi:hypothetical protein
VRRPQDEIAPPPISQPEKRLTKRFSARNATRWLRRPEFQAPAAAGYRPRR